MGWQSSHFPFFPALLEMHTHARIYKRTHWPEMLMGWKVTGQHKKHGGRAGDIWSQELSLSSCHKTKLISDMLLLMGSSSLIFPSLPSSPHFFTYHPLYFLLPALPPIMSLTLCTGKLVSIHAAGNAFSSQHSHYYCILYYYSVTFRIVFSLAYPPAYFELQKPKHMHAHTSFSHLEKQH